MSLNPELTIKPLILVGICFALCVVPLALTRRIHPAPLKPAPLQIKVFWQVVPQSLTTIAMAGMIVGSFYGLAPAFAAAQGMSTQQIATYMATTVAAGLLAQWPMGKISDKIRRSRLIRTNVVILGCLVASMALLPLSGVIQLVLTFCFGVLAFTLYPLATAMANQNVTQSQRVALSATILLTFGIGACVGPILASITMQLTHERMLYGFMALVCLLLFVRLSQVNYQQKQAEKEHSQDYMMAAGDLVSSPLSAALDPRLDEADIKAQMSAHSTSEESSQEDPQQMSLWMQDEFPKTDQDPMVPQAEKAKDD